MKRKTIVKYSLIGVLLIGVGGLTGFIVKRATGQTVVDYSSFNPDDYKADSKLLLRQYENNPNRSFSEAELVNIALEKYRCCENSYSIGIGVASTVVSQTIRNAQIKNGNQYFEESISRSSMVDIANRAYQVGIDNGVTLNKGKANSSEEATYDEAKKTEFTSQNYKDAYGKTLDEMFIYIISNKTVLKEGCSKTKLDSGEMKIVLELNPDTSTYYYKHQMQSISNLDSLPTFKSLTHTYVVDSKMNLIYSKVNEEYKASMGITVNIKNTIEYYYHPNEYYEIPDSKTQINYSIEGEVQYE